MVKHMLKDAVGRVSGVVVNATSIVGSVVTQVVMANLERRRAQRHGGSASPSGQQAEGCPFAAAARAEAEAQARTQQEGTCPFTGQKLADLEEDAQPQQPKAEAKTKEPAKAETKKSEPVAPKAAAAKKEQPAKPAAAKAAVKKTATTKTAAPKKKSATPKAAASGESLSIIIAFEPELSRAKMEKMLRAELYELAKEYDIRGRKDMKKGELIDALQAKIAEA